MENNKIYYVYEYLDPTTKTPFYVGKGKDNRYLHHLKNLNNADNPHKTNKIKKILNLGLVPTINIVEGNLSELEAFALENKLILEYGRVDLGTGCLLNLTNGGEGQSGWIPNDEYRNKMSVKTSGENNGMFGKKHTDETKNKIREKAIGRKFSEETKLKMSIQNIGKKNPFYGKTHTEETIKQISEKKIGRFGGDKNFTAKVFEFVSPKNEKFLIKGGFVNFCNDNNLSIAKMKRNINKGPIDEPKKNPQSMTDESKNCIGWSVKIIKEV